MFPTPIKKTIIYRVTLLILLFISCGRNSETLRPNSFKDLLQKEQIAQYSLDEYFSLLQIDSLKKKFLFETSYFYLKNNDSLEFRKWNSKLLDLAEAKDDSSALAEGYWDLASLFNDFHKYDSAYYYYNRSANLYYEIDDNYSHGRMLLNQAIIQSKVNDYLGSEITSFRAIDILKPLRSFKQLFLAYNNLGVIHNNLGNFNQSLKYHEIAKSYNDNLNISYYEITNLNNIGLAHHNMGEYKEAVSSFEAAQNLKDNISLRFKAIIVDNLGHSELMLGNLDYGRELIKDALNIRYEIKHKGGIVLSYLHLGDYYRFKNQKKGAINYYSKAARLADELNMHSELLDIYMALVEVDKKNEVKYLESHINLTEQLRQEERSIQNQFARIRYETDQIIQKADNLNQQKTYLVIGIILVFILFFLTYIIQMQKARNKKLILERQQQDSNEKIYDLLLRSQQKYEEGSISERKRISRDLHDGILSKFFGIRLNLEVLNSKIDKASEDKRSLYIESLKGVENEIRNISHELSMDFDLSEIGFLYIVKDLLADFEETEDFKIDFLSSPEMNWRIIKNNIKVNFFRIIQESLQNIRKHANANNVEIRIKSEERHLILYIKDDGYGFDFTRKEKGIGLKNIEERAKEINGKFSIFSNKNGTTLQISISKKHI